METVERSIVVNQPVRTVYNQWTQFEEFPRFMTGVEEVQQYDDTRLHWVAEIAGIRREWDAQIVDQVPDEVISWRSTGEFENEGTVTFRPENGDGTRITLRMGYEPGDFVEKAGDMLGVTRSRIEGDLQRFKQFIESRGEETGAWRGEV